MTKSQKNSINILLTWDPSLLTKFQTKDNYKPYLKENKFFQQEYDLCEEEFENAFFQSSPGHI